MKWPAVSSARRRQRFDGCDLNGLSQSTIRGQSRMKGSVGEPHSDQRDHSSTQGVSHDSVRGHRLWTAVKARERRSTITAALVLPFLRRDGLRAARRVVRRSVFPQRIQNVRELTGERHDGDLDTATCGDLFGPLHHRIVRPAQVH